MHGAEQTGPLARPRTLTGATVIPMAARRPGARYAVGSRRSSIRRSGVASGFVK